MIPATLRGCQVNLNQMAEKELLDKIEKRSNEFYKKFTEHDNGYKGEVKIGSDYSIEFDPGQSFERSFTL